MLEKYKDLEAVAGKLGIQGFSMKEAGGKVSISGHTTYQLEKDLFWDNIKKHAGWENELAADIKVEKQTSTATTWCSPASRSRRSPRCTTTMRTATWTSSTPTRTS